MLLVEEHSSVGGWGGSRPRVGRGCQDIQRRKGWSQTDVVETSASETAFRITTPPPPRCMEDWLWNTLYVYSSKC